MKFGDVFRRRGDGLTIMAIGVIAEGHQLAIDEGFTIIDGEPVGLTIDLGAFVPIEGLWLLGGTCYIPTDFLNDAEQLETP